MIRLLDPDDLFIPSCPPAGSNLRYSPRSGERSVFAQSDEELRYARLLRSQFEYDESTQSLVINYHENPVGSPTEIKYAMAEVRSSSGNKQIKAVRMYIHPSIFQDVDQFLELKIRGYERAEHWETSVGPYAGQFCVFKTLNLPKREPKTEPPEKGAAA
jgi:hypothetical protein